MEQQQQQQQQQDETMEVDTTAESLDTSVIHNMLQSCSQGDLSAVQQLVYTHGPIYAAQQDEATGSSPLMAAAAAGHGAVVQYLLEQGAPWNALDRQNQCAGNYATNHQHWGVVNLLVEWGTRAELILGRVERGNRVEQIESTATTEDVPVSHQPSTKPDYLRQRLVYHEDGQSLLDNDQDAVMMQWESPLMKAHADVLMEPASQQHQVQRKRVLNVGFGMGIIDTFLQQKNPAHHIIIEAHPDVYQKMKRDGWDQKPNVRICFGKWQDVLPQLISEGCVVDAAFFDTYGEHYLDLEDFHQQMVQILAKPHGVYSFFNGLAPDNLFFHGVACQCVQLQLASLGLDTEFLNCEIQVQDQVWEGVRRKYWHGRDTYYLPVSKWNPRFLQTGQTEVPLDVMVERAASKRKTDQAGSVVVDAAHVKRQQMDD